MQAAARVGSSSAVTKTIILRIKSCFFFLQVYFDCYLLTPLVHSRAPLASAYSTAAATHRLKDISEMVFSYF